MTTSSFAETEAAAPLRNGGYEADSTSSSGLRSTEEKVEEEEAEDGRRETHPLLASRSFSTSSSSFSSSSSSSSNSPRRPRSSTEVYICHLCSFVGVTRESFDQHMVDCHYIYRCMECSYSARTQGRLKRHLKDTHRKSATIAGHRDSPGRPNPQRPIVGDRQGKVNRRLKIIRCKYCKFITVQKTDFWLHLSEHIPPDKQLRCTKCPFVTDLKHHHEYHQRSHDGFKPFLCQKCGYSCVNKSMLNSHKKSHSNVYRFRCGVCSFAAKYSHALKLHVLKYGHSAGPVLNQDGSLPAAVNVAVQLPTANQAFHQDGTVGGRQISGPSEGTALHQDGRFSSKGMSGCSKQLLVNHVESYSVHAMPALVETEVPLRISKVSTPMCSRIPVFHQNRDADSVPVTFGSPGGDVLHHNGNLSITTNSGFALRRTSNEDDLSLSFGYTNSRREELKDHAGPSSSTAVKDYCCSKETRKEKESPTEEQKKKLVEGRSTLDLSFNSAGVSFPSPTVPPSFQFAPVDLRRPTESAINLSALLQRQRRVPPSLPGPSDFHGRSELSRFYPPATVVQENITAASSTQAGRPFQITDGYSTSTLLPSENQESGMDYEEEPLYPPGGNGEIDTAEIGEFILLDDTRWDNVELERPLDLSNWKGSTVERKETLTTPTSWDDLHVHMFLPSSLPPHQTFSPTTFPSSSSTTPTPYHLGQTVPSFLQQPASRLDRPPPLLPLPWTHPRNETRDPDRYQLNDKDDEVLTSHDPDHQGNGSHHPNYPPFPHDDIDSSPMKVEWRLDESDPSFECRHCRMFFHDYVMFAIHSDHHGYVDPFVCNMCGEKCEDRIQFFLHISRVAHH